MQEYSDKQRQTKTISRIVKRKIILTHLAQHTTDRRANSTSERTYFGVAIGHNSRLFLHTGVAHRNCTNHCRCNSLMLNTRNLVNSCEDRTNTSSLCYGTRLRSNDTSVEGIKLSFTMNFHLIFMSQEPIVTETTSYVKLIQLKWYYY